MLPGGRLLSLIPQRCICRQSNLGGVNLVGAILMSPAFSPFKMRIAATAATAHPFLYRMHRTADDCAIEEYVKVGEDGSVGGGREPVQRGIGLVRNACRIDIHQVPEDGAVRRKTCCVFQNVFE